MTQGTPELSSSSSGPQRGSRSWTRQLDPRNLEAGDHNTVSILFRTQTMSQHKYWTFVLPVNEVDVRIKIRQHTLSYHLHSSCTTAATEGLYRSADGTVRFSGGKETVKAVTQLLWKLSLISFSTKEAGRMKRPIRGRSIFSYSPWSLLARTPSGSQSLQGWVRGGGPAGGPGAAPLSDG